MRVLFLSSRRRLVQITRDIKKSDTKILTYFEIFPSNTIFSAAQMPISIRDQESRIAIKLKFIQRTTDASGSLSIGYSDFSNRIM